MGYLDILYDILTSTFVVGIATYLIQKRIDRRFNQIEEFQKALITIRKERYDTLLKTLQDIWEKIIETEYYIRHDLNKQVENARGEKSVVLDSTPLKDALIFIDKRSILLTDNLFNKTKNLFKNYLVKTYNNYIQILNLAIAGQKTLKEVNDYIPKALGKRYKKKRNKLRKEFEKQARQILYDDIKSSA